jgi:hypothetical protein
MSRADASEIRMRLVIENPAPGVGHSLQDKKNRPLDAQASKSGEALTFELSLRIAHGPKFSGEQVRSEGLERRSSTLPAVDKLATLRPAGIVA